MKRAGLLALVPLFLSQTAHAQESASGRVSGRVSTQGGSGLSASAGGGSAAAQAPQDEFAVRDAQLNEAATLTGGVGLIHTQHAQGSAPGQFRIAFTTEWFTSSDFLCTSAYPCPNPTAPGQTVTTDSHDHIGGRLTLSVQVLKWLETYLATSATGDSNDRNRPALLQVLGDSIVGAKVHGRLTKMLHAGGALELWLVNGTGSVGLDGGGTGGKLRAMLTADLREADKRIPLRFSVNGTYVLDNTGQVVESTEAARGVPVNRIERFGLGVNRVDHFDVHVGAEALLSDEKVRPLVEYNLQAPINRQGYQCRQDNPSHDGCLANQVVVPSSLTLGARFFPWKRGFSLTAALDIGITGVGTFIEEVRPTPPWMLYLGAGWAFDTVDRPPVTRVEVVEKAVGKPGRKVRALVHEEGKTDPIPGAIVSWENHPELTSLVTGSDGRFTTQDLEEGTYVFGLRAEGYRPAQCSASVVLPRAAGAAPAPVPAGGTPAPRAAPAAPEPLEIDCAMQALPRMGNVVGRVIDAATQSPVGNVALRFVDAAKKELRTTSDAAGSFRFDQAAPGEAEVIVDAEGYLAATQLVDIKPREDNRVDVVLHKRPKEALVSVGKQEIVIKQQIQFAVDSSVILPESTGLLTEIADVLIKNPRIRRVEVQGHTDNTGTPEHNQNLSDGRAAAVVAWLTAHGVDASRLVARGFGQTKPLVPNVTAGNRAKNRRVQFIILDQDAPAPASKR